VFKRIDYLTIKMVDAAGAAQVWEVVLGLKGSAPQAMDGVRSVSVPVGDAFLEMAQSEGTGSYGDWLGRQAEGMCLVGIEVDDLAGAMAHLRARGAQVSEELEGSAPGVRFALVDPASTHGVPIAIVQRSK
jgi:hypothetical protein